MVKRFQVVSSSSVYLKVKWLNTTPYNASWTRLCLAWVIGPCISSKCETRCPCVSMITSPTKVCCQGVNNHDYIHFWHCSKCFLIINSISLSVSFCYHSCLVLINSTIRHIFYSVYLVSQQSPKSYFYPMHSFLHSWLEPNSHPLKLLVLM